MTISDSWTWQTGSMYIGYEFYNGTWDWADYNAGDILIQEGSGQSLVTVMRLDRIYAAILNGPEAGRSNVNWGGTVYKCPMPLADKRVEWTIYP